MQLLESLLDQYIYSTHTHTVLAGQFSQDLKDLKGGLRIVYTISVYTRRFEQLPCVLSGT